MSSYPSTPDDYRELLIEYYTMNPTNGMSYYDDATVISEEADRYVREMDEMEVMLEYCKVVREQFKSLVERSIKATEGLEDLNELLTGERVEDDLTPAQEHERAVNELIKSNVRLGKVVRDLTAKVVDQTNNIFSDDNE